MSNLKFDGLRPLILANIPVYKGDMQDGSAVVVHLRQHYDTASFKDLLLAMNDLVAVSNSRPKHSNRLTYNQLVGETHPEKIGSFYDWVMDNDEKYGTLALLAIAIGYDPTVSRETSKVARQEQITAYKRVLYAATPTVVAPIDREKSLSEYRVEFRKAFGYAGTLSANIETCFKSEPESFFEFLKDFAKDNIIEEDKMTWEDLLRGAADSSIYVIMNEKVIDYCIPRKTSKGEPLLEALVQTVWDLKLKDKERSSLKDDMGRDLNFIRNYFKQYPIP